MIKRQQLDKTIEKQRAATPGSLASNKSHTDSSTNDMGDTFAEAVWPADQPWQPHDFETSTPFHDWTIIDQDQSLSLQRAQNDLIAPTAGAPYGMMNSIPATHQRAQSTSILFHEDLNSAEPSSSWPSTISDEDLISWIEVYFDRLYPTLPVLKRSAVFARLLSREHKRNPDFGAMLLALCAFSLVQPVRISEWSSALSREAMVKYMLAECVKTRASANFGETPSLDTILTSVFLFACLFQRNEHNAARLKLREAVELGCIIGLHEPEFYTTCDASTRRQQLGLYYLLSVTER